MRPATSAPEPAVKGTIMRTVLFGKPCACACVAAMQRATADSATANWKLRFIVVSIEYSGYLLPSTRSRKLRRA